MEVIISLLVSLIAIFFLIAFLVISFIVFKKLIKEELLQKDLNGNPLQKQSKIRESRESSITTTIKRLENQIKKF